MTIPHSVADDGGWGPAVQTRHAEKHLLLAINGKIGKTFSTAAAISPKVPLGDDEVVRAGGRHYILMRPHAN